MLVICLGAGRMGSQIGCEYALGGHTVVFITHRAGPARERVAAALRLARRYRLAPAAALASAPKRISFRSRPAGEEPAALVVESLPEDREIKQRNLAWAADAWPEATIATNTSSLGISELGRLAGVSTRIVATHYWNPPLLMPLVEMVAGDETAPERVEAVARTLRRLGKRPILLAAEVPGMLWNRLQLAMLRECLWLADNHIATPAQIDEVVRDGLARRWRLVGPFETVSLGGADVFDAIAENLFPVLSQALTGSFGPYVHRDPASLSKIARRRDDGLAAELRTERRAGDR
jgi:3-hydroxybutyryl-CoA dehydrogenase